VTAEVVNLDVVTTLPIPVERIIRKAGDADLDQVIIIGVDKAGELFFSSSEADGGTVLWWLELAKKRLLDIGDGE
jgi:hypothetical protein